MGKAFVFARLRMQRLLWIPTNKSRAWVVGAIACIVVIELVYLTFFARRSVGRACDPSGCSLLLQNISLTLSSVASLVEQTSRRLPPASGIATVERDCELQGLVRLLNSEGLALQRAAGATAAEPFAASLVSALAPWLLGGRAAGQLGAPSEPEPWSASDSRRKQQAPTGLQCQAPAFASVFADPDPSASASASSSAPPSAGSLRGSPRFVVDFVSLAFDVDLLEVRLAETFDEVDLFVVSEATVTPTGVPKPLIFNELRQTQRFARYLSKVMHVVFPSSDEDRQQLAELLPRARKGDAFKLEQLLRRYPVHRLSEALLQDSILHAAVTGDGRDEFLALQNEPEELTNVEMLRHLRWCQMRPSLQWPLFIPPVAVKGSTHWLQTTQALAHVRMPPLDTTELSSHLWTLGPYMWRLRDFLRAGHTKRYENVFRGGFLRPGLHLGLGGAVRFGGGGGLGGDPAAAWLMRGYLDPQSKEPPFSREFLRRASNGSLEVSDVVDAAAAQWCGQEVPLVSAGSLSPAAQAVLRRSVPALLREGGGRRWCFVDPLPSGPMGLRAKERWHRLCSSDAAKKVVPPHRKSYTLVGARSLPAVAEPSVYRRRQTRQ